MNDQIKVGLKLNLGWDRWSDFAVEYNGLELGLKLNCFFVFTYQNCYTVNHLISFKFYMRECRVNLPSKLQGLYWCNLKFRNINEILLNRFKYKGYMNL